MSARADISGSGVLRIGVALAMLAVCIAYQQLENYAIYPRVMSKSVDIPGAVTVIAASSS